jgi:hypothetical protein
LTLFFDEDLGTSVPRALDLVGVRVEFVGSSRRLGIPKGTPDETWLPQIGKNGWLLFSCNTGILKAEAQRQLFINEKVGAVFLNNGQEKKLDLLRMILNKLAWLEHIDVSTPRPFAYGISIKGRAKAIHLSNVTSEASMVAGS